MELQSSNSLPNLRGYLHSLPMGWHSILKNSGYQERPTAPLGFQALLDCDAVDRIISLETAMVKFKRSSALNISIDSKSVHSQACAWQKTGHLAGSLSTYGEVIDLDPDFTLAYIYRAQVLRSLGRYNDALQDYDDAVRTNSESGRSHIGRGQVLEDLGRFDEALVAYSRAIEAAHNCYDFLVRVEPRKNIRNELTLDRDQLVATGHLLRADVHRNQERFEEALTDYAKALQLSPLDGNAFVARGWLYEKQGQLDLARFDYEKAASLMIVDDWLRQAIARSR